VLCSLHQVELAIEFADRIVAIQDGAVVYDGAPSDLTEQRLDEVYGAERSARSARPGEAGAGAGAGSAGPSGEAA
jgi:phosphonate transport system ATP-binding protein